MKFKDPKTGEVYEDIGAAVIAMCGRQGGCSSAKENTCPILRKTQWLNQSCYDWAISRPSEAMRLMGYEVVEEETPKTKPLAWQVLKNFVGNPVYLHIYGDWSGWAILRHYDKRRKQFRFDGCPNQYADTYMKIGTHWLLSMTRMA